MDDYSLVPVEHQPDFENVSLVPVPYDPFSDDGVTQQAQNQQAQDQPAQPQPQRTATGRIYVGPLAKNRQASETGEPSNPDAEDNGAAGSNRSAASAPAQDQPAHDWSRLNQPFGELKPWTPIPTQRIGYLAADGLMALGASPYNANELVRRIGNLLGLTPLGVIGSAFDFIDAKHRDDFPGAVTAAIGMIPGAKGVGRVVAGEGGAGLRALTNATPRSPASRAIEKGYAGVGTTRNGGATFVGTEHLYPVAPGQRNVVQIPLTGSRTRDVELANKEGGFAVKPKGHVWHHVDDFNPQNGESSLELIKERAHWAINPHSGSVAQWEKFHGKRYKR
jgi:hypothetical protein